MEFLQLDGWNFFIRRRIVEPIWVLVVLYFIAALTAKHFDDRVLAPCQEARRLTVRSDTIILRRKSNFYQSKGGYDHLSSSYFHTMDQIGHESLHSSIVKNQRLKSQITHNFVLLNFLKGSHSKSDITLWTNYAVFIINALLLSYVKMHYQRINGID